MSEVVRGYAPVDGGQVHYRTSGPPGAFPLVLLHQTASSSVMFEAVMALLPHRRCVAVDTPGFGASTPLADVTVDGWAAAIVAALDHLDIEEFDLCGHHTGAAIAVAVAAAHPDRVRRLALGGPPLLGDASKRRIADRATPLVLAADGSHLLEAWRQSARYAPNGPLDLIQRETVLTMVADAPDRAMLAVIDFDLAGVLDTVTAPLLVFAGDRDPIIEGVEAVAARVPTARVEVIPDGGVHVCEEQAEAVAALLDEFLEGEAK